MTVPGMTPEEPSRAAQWCDGGAPVMTGDRAIRYSTVAAVSVVALVAAFVSYRHALQVVRVHGESGPLALAYPLTIDGLIYAASMVLLDAARRGARPHWLAYAGLALGITATVAANVAAGLAYGPVGAVVAAWPAAALVIAYELLMLVIRGSVTAAPEPASAVEAHPAPRWPIGLELAGAVSPWPGQGASLAAAPEPASDADAPASEPPAGLNGHAAEAASLFAADVAAGRVPGLRAIQSQMRIGQAKAQQVQAHLREITHS